MFVCHPLTRRLAATVVLLLVGVPLFAQMPGDLPIRVHLKGTIAALRPGSIQVTTASGEPWLVQLPRQTSVMVTGQSDATLLRAGMYVKFQVQLTGRQKVGGPIDKIQVFTPTDHETPGAFPVQRADPVADEHAARSDGAMQPVATYDVVGRITNVQRGRAVVSYGSGSIDIALAADLQVALAVADIRFARLRDEIVCIGYLVGPEAARTARASSIQIHWVQAPHAPGPDAAARPPETPDEKPAARDEKQSSTDRLVALLTPRQGSRNDESFAIKDDPTEFRPCARRSAAGLSRQFGQPEKKDVEGTLTVHDRARPGTWQMWTWGPVRVIVDRSKKTRFIAVKP